MKGNKKLHGNQAKVDPAAHIPSLYESNTVTLSQRKEDETPIVSEENVKYAKRFVEMNEK